MTLPACPDCGAPLVIDPDSYTEQPWFCPHPGAMPTIEYRRRACTVVFCTGCEFAVELTGREE